MVYDGTRRWAWSSRAPEVTPVDPGALLHDVGHLVVCPVWSAWTESLLAEAHRRGTPCSLIGDGTLAARAHRWHTVVLDERQAAILGAVDADTLVVTRGAEGATVRAGGEVTTVPAVGVAPVDTTGAGDTFGGVFLGQRLRGASGVSAGEQAAAAAAKACEGWGAWAAFTSTSPARGVTTVASRVRGALAGLACGDAFGMPNSFLRVPAWRTGMQPGPADSPLRGDTDTVAAIAGAICGAHAGLDAIPAVWRDRVAEVNALDVDAWARRLEALAGH